ncbi:hypothetical protein ACU4GD_22655 [Cupriavidus basilensis]
MNSATVVAGTEGFTAMILGKRVSSTHRREILLEVEGQLLVQRDIDGAGIGTQQDRVAIVGRARHAGRRDIAEQHRAGSPRQKLCPSLSDSRVSHQPGHGIGRTAGRIADHDLDGLGRIRRILWRGGVRGGRSRPGLRLPGLKRSGFMLVCSKGDRGLARMAIEISALYRLATGRICRQAHYPQFQSPESM